MTCRRRATRRSTRSPRSRRRHGRIGRRRRQLVRRYGARERQRSGWLRRRGLLRACAFQKSRSAKIWRSLLVSELRDEQILTKRTDDRVMMMGKESGTMGCLSVSPKPITAHKSRDVYDGFNQHFGSVYSVFKNFRSVRSSAFNELHRTLVV